MNATKKNLNKKTFSKTQNSINSKFYKEFVFNNDDYNSGDGMLTTVWGPALWHYLHTMSFNYPVNPTINDKKHYKDFINNLVNVLPCKYCRINLKNNLKKNPIKMCHLKNRETFSRFVYELHEIVNKMLNKNSKLTYYDVRERYEHFRSRCVTEKPRIFNFNKTKKKKEKGCTEPLYGKKSKCIISIVPQEDKKATFQIDKKCIKYREKT